MHEQCVTTERRHLEPCCTSINLSKETLRARYVYHVLCINSQPEIIMKFLNVLIWHVYIVSYWHSVILETITIRCMFDDCCGIHQNLVTLGVVLRQVIFNLFLSIQLYAVKYIDQYDKALSQCSVVNNIRFGRLITNWTVANITFNVTLFGMSLDISV